jgi:hypothetical protein
MAVRTRAAQLRAAKVRAYRYTLTLGDEIQQSLLRIGKRHVLILQISNQFLCGTNCEYAACITVPNELGYNQFAYAVPILRVHRLDEAADHRLVCFGY